MKRLILPIFALFLLAACAEGSQWGQWFPEEEKDPEEQFFCDYYGNCPKERSDKCDLWGNCEKDEKDQTIWGRKPVQGNVYGTTKSCDFYGNCTGGD